MNKLSTDLPTSVSNTLVLRNSDQSINTQMGTQVVRASTSCKGTNVQMDKQGSERHVLLHFLKLKKRRHNQKKKKGATTQKRKGATTKKKKGRHNQKKERAP